MVLTIFINIIDNIVQYPFILYILNFFNLFLIFTMRL